MKPGSDLMGSVLLEMAKWSLCRKAKQHGLEQKNFDSCQAPSLGRAPSVGANENRRMPYGIRRFFLGLSLNSA